MVENRPNFKGIKFTDSEIKDIKWCLPHSGLDFSSFVRDAVMAKVREIKSEVKQYAD